MIRKNNIDLEVAARLGVERKNVALITSLFLEYMREGLAKDGQVIVDGLGGFAVQSYKAKEVGPDGIGPVTVTKVRVHFRKSRMLKAALHERIKEGESYGKIRR